MLTSQVPMLLALLGTALMAVVIFAPSRMPRPVAFSLAPPQAPPHAPPVVPRWEPATAVTLWDPLPAITEWEQPPVIAEWEQPQGGVPCESSVPMWPALVDRRAAGCDAAARLGLVEALGTVRAPWSDAILRSALDDEPDFAVREAVMKALAA